MLLAVKVDESFGPVDVSSLVAQAVMPNTQRFMHLIEQPRRLCCGGISGERRVMLHGKAARYVAPMVQLNLR